MAKITIAATFALYAEQGTRTYEDIQEFYAAQGWGCKCCGQLSAPSWWTCAAGDIYCDACKEDIRKELRIRFEAFPTRAASGLSRTVVHVYDPASAGWEYAQWQREEHKRIYG